METFLKYAFGTGGEREQRSNLGRERQSEREETTPLHTVNIEDLDRYVGYVALCPA